jgi:amino acid transporter
MAGYVGYIFRLSAAGLKAAAIGSIVFVALVNIRGVRLGGWLVRWLTVLKVSLLGLLIVWGFGMRLGNWSNFTPLVAQRPGSEPLIGALAGLVGAFFSSVAGGSEQARERYAILNAHCRCSDLRRDDLTVVWHSDKCGGSFIWCRWNG